MFHLYHDNGWLGSFDTLQEAKDSVSRANSGNWMFQPGKIATSQPCNEWHMDGHWVIVES